MKIMKIFGMVLAIHLVPLMIFLLSPGCQTTPSQPTANGPSTADSGNWSSQPEPSSSLEPIPVSDDSSSLSQPLYGATPAERARRESPSRPGASNVSPSDSVLSPLYQGGSTSGGGSSTITYTVKKGDSFWSIAKKFNISVKALQSANSNIRADQLQWGAKIEIPGQSADAASSQPQVSTAAPIPVTNTGAFTTYKVKSGDYLARIAANHGTTVKAVRSANNLRSDLIRIGQTLKIPSSSGQASSSTTTSTQRRTGSAPSDAVTVTVQAGDTLESIARKFEVSIKELMDVNGITNPRSIRPNQVLVVPGFQSITSKPTVTVQPTVPEVQTADQEPVEITGTLPLLPDDDLDSMLPEDIIDAPAIPIDEEPLSSD